eukprot:TRINITY_DN10607_c0_g1_i1.p1 TRINITY_DN10607_c0_g1~~TRINITY_DN10607_c0_g1_i1.p1  ORF type:complete len:323 (-),score=29.08 TRINITY_DN10607_c0_g1_i1:472-1440(-)
MMSAENTMNSEAGSNVSSTASGVTEHDYITGLSESSSSSTTASFARTNRNKHDAAAKATHCEDDAELSLGLSLSCKNPKQDEFVSRRSVSHLPSSFAGLPWQGVETPRASAARFLTAEDLQKRPVVLHEHISSGFAQPRAISVSSRVSVTPSSGVKRLHNASDSSDTDQIPQGQVVGWPPIGAYRSKTRVAQSRSPLYVKVNMDGVPIGRKVDLNAHDSYEALAFALEDMFQCSTGVNGQTGSDNAMHMGLSKPKRLRLLDSSSDFVLTYEDKEGDWMLVGDVPWRMFVSTVKRLKIMKRSEVNGLGPKCAEHTDRTKNRVH